MKYAEGGPNRNIFRNHPVEDNRVVEMVSSKGEPDNPELREEVKEEVKNLEKGGGKGSWSAWKAGELSKRYEARGGGYIAKEDSKNKPEKGAPQKKDDKKGKK